MVGFVCTFLDAIGSRKRIKRLAAIKTDSTTSTFKEADSHPQDEEDQSPLKMAGPYTPTLMALLTRAGLLKIKPEGFNSFKNHVACITGAASGIGSALALQAAQEGARGLLLCDLSWSEDSVLATEIEARGVDVVTLSGDVGQKAEAQRMADARCLLIPNPLSSFQPQT